MPQDLPPGATIAGRLEIPNDGPVAVGMGSVWVIDRANEQMDNSVPAATLFRVDPALQTDAEAIPHVLGGSIVVAENEIWVGSFLTDRLLRIDPSDHTITTIESGPSEDEGPTYLVSTPGAVWVANHHAGTLGRIDPVTGELSDTVPLVPAGPAGPQGMATDGPSIWVGVPRERAVFQIDVSTKTVTQTTSVDGEACGGIAVDEANTVWVTNSECDGANLVFRIDPTTNRVVAIFDLQATAVDVEVALGSVWVATTRPAQLIRIDGATNRVTGRLELPSNPAGAANSLAVGENAIWVRVLNELLRVMPS